MNRGVRNKLNTIGRNNNMTLRWIYKQFVRDVKGVWWGFKHFTITPSIITITNLVSRLYEYSKPYVIKFKDLLSHYRKKIKYSYCSHIMLGTYKEETFTGTNIYCACTKCHYVNKRNVVDFIPYKEDVIELTNFEYSDKIK
jgi:hypothetical protein